MNLANINTSQTIFTLFYAIIWGTLANVWSRWGAFSWPLMWDPQQKVVQRGVLSLIIINIVPILFFAYMFLSLANYALGTSIYVAFLKLTVIILQPFALFGFYWIWVGIIQTFPSRFYPHKPWRSYYPKLTDHDFKRRNAPFNILMGCIYILLPQLLFILACCLTSRSS